jgi:hypothetical protein
MTGVLDAASTPSRQGDGGLGAFCVGTWFDLCCALACSIGQRQSLVHAVPNRSR